MDPLIYLSRISHFEISNINLTCVTSFLEYENSNNNNLLSVHSFSDPSACQTAFGVTAYPSMTINNGNLVSWDLSDVLFDVKNKSNITFCEGASNMKIVDLQMDDSVVFFANETEISGYFFSQNNNNYVFSAPIFESCYQGNVGEENDRVTIFVNNLNVTSSGIITMFMVFMSIPVYFF